VDARHKHKPQRAVQTVLTADRGVAAESDGELARSGASRPRSSTAERYPAS
jgi:hypothetical protein